MSFKDPKPMMDLDKLRIFHAVVEAKTFTHAADDLSVNQSTVSRQISQLEEELHTQLFQRNPRGLHLTEQGELLFEATREIFRVLAETEARLLETREHPQGLFRVTATVGLGTYWLMPRVKEFIELYPEIDLKVILEDRELALDMREADVAIRMRQPIQPDLIQRKIFDVHYGVYAANSYVKQKGTPANVSELDKHNLIIYGDAPAELRSVNWLIEFDRKPGDYRRPVLCINSLPGMLAAVESGLGIACLPDYLGRTHPNLTRMECPLAVPPFEAHLCYVESMKGSKRVAVFRDFLMRQARDWIF